jgi:hypothetical protein
MLFSNTNNINYKNYIIVFKDNCKYNLYNFKIYNCFFYKEAIFKEILIKVYFLTIKVSVLYINKGGI